MDLKSMKLLDFQKLILDNGGENIHSLSNFNMDGLTFQDAIQLVRIFHKHMRQRMSIVRDIHALMPYNEKGIKVDGDFNDKDYEWPVL